MAKVYQFMADGFEDIEALIPVDVLRRGGVDIQTVSITDSNIVESAHGVQMVTDLIFEEADLSDADLLMLPGGMPGALNLNEHEGLKKALVAQAEAGKMVSAICAAPMVLGGLGILRGKRATCYPGFEDELKGATCTGALVEVDGQFITGKGPAAVFEFGYAIVEMMKDKATADALRQGMLWSEVR